MDKLDELARLDAVAQAELVARKELRATELIDAFARRLEWMNPLIRAVVTVDLERARQRAEQSPAGPLFGVPFLIKDVVAYPDLRCSMGSRLFRGFVPPVGSPFTDRLDAAGLICVGKTATSELGLLGSTETLLEGVTHNPWDLSYSAAGSSGGAAAAVAAGIVPMAHANDGGGSIRVPAAVCGLFGLKPSRGRCAAAGEMRSDFFDPTSDLCISRTVRDSARLLSLVEAPDAGLPPVGYVREPATRRLRIGVLATTLLGAEPDPAVRAALEDAAALCAGLRHAVTWIAPPKIDGAAVSDAFFFGGGALLAGLVDGLAQQLGRPIGAGDLEPFTRALISGARARAPALLEQGRAALAQAARCYLDLFTAGAGPPLDVILTPTLAVPPWRLGHLSPLLPRAEIIRRTEEAVGYTPIHNVAGCPAMSVPLHFPAAGLPLGAHFAARPGEDATLLGLAYELEAARPWRERWAPLSFPVLQEEGCRRS